MRWISLFALVCACEAHVRLIHKSYFSRPIRNAPSASADGTLSTAGPCGGSQKWGNASFSQVTEGQNVSLVFAYNGGHQDPILNMLRISMLCGRINADKNLGNKSASVAVTTSPLVNASLSSTAGYDLWVIIPPINKMQVNGSFCTISALDERNWGGCIDVEVLSSNVPPSTVNALDGLSLAGTYPFTEKDCIPDSPSCCCATGTITVVHTTGATTATAAVKIDPSPLCVSPNKTISYTITSPQTLTQVAINLASVKGVVKLGPNSTLGFVVEAGTPNRVIVTDDSAMPSICGLQVAKGVTPGGTVPGGSDGSAASVLQWSGSVFFALFFAFVCV